MRFIRSMCDLAEQGVGIVMISSDLPEIIGICDRAIIMSEGHITGEVPRNEFSQGVYHVVCSRRE